MAPLPSFIPALPARFCGAPKSATAPLPRRPPLLCSTAPPPSAPDVEDLFARLKHVNKNLRKKASAELADIATEPIIARLVSLLDVEDVSYRRTAVQALAMTGTPALPSVLAQLKSTQNPTIRASCSKVIAGIALFFPELREEFSVDALDALKSALQNADPVTKLATVGCLATLGSDQKQKDQIIARGNERALQILLSECNAEADIAVAATVVGALAQIAQNGSPERKQAIISHLECLTDSSGPDDQSGVNYVQDIAKSHLEQLKSASAASAPSSPE